MSLCANSSEIFSFNNYIIAKVGHDEIFFDKYFSTDFDLPSHFTIQMYANIYIIIQRQKALNQINH